MMIVESRMRGNKMDISKRNEYREKMIIARKLNDVARDIRAAVTKEVEDIFQKYENALKEAGGLVAGLDHVATNEKYKLDESIAAITQRLSAVIPNLCGQDMSEWIEVVGELLDDLDKKDAEIARLKGA